MNAPVFLLGSHKSGSSLVRSLLDGHPGLAVLPKETHPFQFGNHWVDYRLRRNLPQPMSREQWLESLLDQIREDSRPEPYADAPRFKGYDMGVLRDRLREVDPSELRSFLVTYLSAAYEAADGRPLPGEARIVEKSVEHAEFACTLASLFPGAQFIHIMRNPYATMVAIRRTWHKRRGRYPFMAPIASAMRNSYYHAFKNPLGIRNYLFLRFEDLLRSPEEAMRRVANFLNIEFTHSLLKPTSMGSAWAGNSSSNLLFEGISTRPLEEWRQHINDFEIALAHLAADPVFGAFGYDRLTAAHPFRRARSEHFRTYLANRLALRLGF